MKRQMLTTIAAATFVFSGGVGVALADAPEPRACTIRVDTPNKANDASIGRDGCSSKIPGSATIKEERQFLPDPIVGAKDSNFFGYFFVKGSCGNGAGYYYSQFDSSTGATARSTEAYRC